MEKLRTENKELAAKAAKLGRPRRVLSDDEQARIYRMHLAGKTINQISADQHIATRTISRIIKTYDKEQAEKF